MFMQNILFLDDGEFEVTKFQIRSEAKDLLVL